MSRLLTFLHLVAFPFRLSVGQETNIDERIVNGDTASNGQFPYQASLRYPLNGHFCGGSVISNQWVLTAGHCLDGMNVDLIQIYVGTNYLFKIFQLGDNYLAQNGLVHPNYDPTIHINDVGLLNTASPIQFGIKVEAIALSSSVPNDGAEGVVSGWGLTMYGGTTLPNELQYLLTKIVKWADCRTLILNAGYSLHSSQICTFQATSGFCNGDSGGPLVVNNQQVGIVSLSAQCSTQYPDIYASVPALYSWITTTAEL